MMELNDDELILRNGWPMKKVKYYFQEGPSEQDLNLDRSEIKP